MKTGTIILAILALASLSACSGIDVHAGFNFVDSVKTERVTKDKSFAERVRKAWDTVTGNQQEEGK